MYTSLIADATRRWQHIENPHLNIRFATGTDEHGTKIQRASAKDNIPVKDYCTNISEQYKIMSRNFNIGFTDFIRTTDEIHANAVQKLWVRI